MNRLTVLDVENIRWRKAQRLGKAGGSGYFSTIDLEMRTDEGIVQVELYLADEAQLEEFAAALGFDIDTDARQDNEPEETEEASA